MSQLGRTKKISILRATVNQLCLTFVHISLFSKKKWFRQANLALIETILIHNNLTATRDGWKPNQTSLIVFITTARVNCKQYLLTKTQLVVKVAGEGRN